MMDVLERQTPVLNHTYEIVIENFGFGNLSSEECKEIFKDGRVFSHFIELWICKYFLLTHVKGCKDHDFIDKNNVKYDEKTFTQRGCNFCPSNMLGQGRTFDRDVFIEKSKRLIFCIVSNVDFPNIKIKFVKGEDLVEKYPTGKISFNDIIKFFN